jgi:hypothetical protein
LEGLPAVLFRMVQVQESRQILGAIQPGIALF